MSDQTAPPSRRSVTSLVPRSIKLERWHDTHCRDVQGFPPRFPSLTWERELESSEEMAYIYKHVPGAPAPAWFGGSVLEGEYGPALRRAVRMLHGVACGVTVGEWGSGRRPAPRPPSDDGI